MQQVGALAGSPLALFGLLFVFSFLNVFFPPIPIELGAVFLGYLSGIGKCSLAVALSGTVSGMFLGSLLLFALCRRYGLVVIEKTPLRRAISKDAYERAERWVAKYGIWTLFLGKIAPGMCLCTVACCGVFRLGIRRAAIGILLSNLVFFALLALAGRLLGENWARATAWLAELSTAALVTLAAIVVIAAVLVVRGLRRQGKSPHGQDPHP